MKSLLRRLYLRVYPMIVTIWLLIANRVTALDVGAIDEQGQAPPKAAEQIAGEALEPQTSERVRDSRTGIRLSRAALPPGDPVLSVDAPEDAREVTAYFPFGLVKRLQLDLRRGQWLARFLVPRDVADGVYTINVRIVDARGGVSWKSIEYVIDGTEPELTVLVDEFAWAGDPLHVAVDPLEPVQEVFVTLPEVGNGRVKLKLDTHTGLYEGKIRVPLEFPRDQIKLRVVARDRARNTVQEEVLVPVTFDGC